MVDVNLVKEHHVDSLHFFFFFGENKKEGSFPKKKKFGIFISQNLRLMSRKHKIWDFYFSDFTHLSA